MKHLPFDYCDGCQKKFLIEKLDIDWLCEGCNPDWKPCPIPHDDYDRFTKNKDDQQ